MIQTQGLCKSYGAHQVLCDITLSLQRGKIHGFIGRNGSGKTVLFKILCGLTRPTKGIVQIDGHELGREMEIPPSLGAIINVPGFMPHMSGWRNLVLLASIRKSCTSADIRHAMQRVGLDPDLRTPAGKYSMGMRQRLGIAQAIMGRSPAIGAGRADERAGQSRRGGNPRIAARAAGTGQNDSARQPQCRGHSPALRYRARTR